MAKSSVTAATCALSLSIGGAYEADRFDSWRARQELGLLEAINPMEKTYAWLGRDVSGTGIPKLLGQRWRKQRTAILFMPRCPSCQIDGDSLDPHRLRLETPLILVTDNEEVHSLYKRTFILDKNHLLLPPEWTMTGSHLFFINAEGQVDEIVSGKDGVRLRLSK